MKKNIMEFCTFVFGFIFALNLCIALGGCNNSWTPAPIFKVGDCTQYKYYYSYNPTPIYKITYVWDHGVELTPIANKNYPTAYRTWKSLENDYQPIDCSASLYSDRD